MKLKRCHSVVPRGSYGVLARENMCDHNDTKDWINSLPLDCCQYFDGQLAYDDASLVCQICEVKHIKLMSLSHAARRLLETIAAIEAREANNEKKKKRMDAFVDHGDVEAKVREKVLAELRTIEAVVKSLDDKYEDLRYDFECDI